jgi:hypothetical protein
MDNTTQAQARRLVGDFTAATSYVQTHDVDVEEWTNTIGEALLDLIVRYAEAHGAAPEDVARSFAEQFEAMD